MHVAEIALARHKRSRSRQDAESHFAQQRINAGVIVPETDELKSSRQNVTRSLIDRLGEIPDELVILAMILAICQNFHCLFNIERF